MAKLGDGSSYYIVGSPSKHEVYYTDTPKDQHKTTTTSATEETSPSSLSSSAPIPISPIGISTYLGIYSMKETRDSEEPTAQPPTNSKPESNLFFIFPFDDVPGNTELLGLEGSDSAT